MIAPDSSVPFHLALTRRALITQVTFQFRVRDRNDIKATPEQLFAPVHTRQLYTLPMPPDIKVISPEQ
jgi:hypothetical protein